MAFVHHTMLTAENLRGLPSKQLHTNVEPHYSPRSRAAPLCGVGGLVGVYSRPVIGGTFFKGISFVDGRQCRRVGKFEVVSEVNFFVPGPGSGSR